MYFRLIITHTIIKVLQCQGSWLYCESTFLRGYQFSWILCLYQNKIRWFYIFNMISFTGYQNFEKLRESLNTLDRWAVKLCNRKWNVRVNINMFCFSIYLFFIRISTLESEQKQLLNFINMDQCNVLFYRIWKLKKTHLKLFVEHVH